MTENDPKLDGSRMTDELIQAAANELYPDHKTVPCEVRVHHKDERITSLRGTLDLATGVVTETEKPTFWHESPVTKHTIDIPGVQG